MAARLDQLAATFAAVPFVRTIGVEVAALAPDRATLWLPHQEHNGNRNGSLHGGVLSSLIGLGGALAARSGGEVDVKDEIRTIDLAVQFLAPAVREGVRADATVVRSGREIVFLRVDVVSIAGVPIANGLVATRMVTPADEPPATAREDVCADIPPGIGTRLRASGSPFSARLGVRSARLASGAAVAILPDQPAVEERPGRIAEGALATLADCAAGAAAWSVGGYDPRGRAATISMHLTCGVAQRGEDLVAVARTSWHSAGLFVNAVLLAGRDSHRPVAAGAVTYRIVRPDG